MAPKPAVVEQQPINAIPYYPPQQQQIPPGNYNANLAWYQQAPQANLIVPNIQNGNINNSYNGGQIIVDPIKRLKIQYQNLIGLSCCCFVLSLLLIGVVGGYILDRSSPNIETQVNCYYSISSGETNNINYTEAVYTQYNSGNGDQEYYAQSTISGELNSPSDLIVCSFTTNFDYIQTGYFIFYYSYESDYMCLDFESEPSTRCTTSEAIQYTQSCEDLYTEPSECANKYLIMNYQNYQSSEIFISTAQGVSDSYVDFTLNYSLVFDIEERGTPFFYATLLLLVLALIFFCGSCFRCLMLKKKIDKAQIIDNAAQF